MINREVLEALGPNGVLINVARGSVVDEQALIKLCATRRFFQPVWTSSRTSRACRRN
jgi:lactate dehydrogenase-like 2-hydroxyacid dehydrogenase